MKLQALHCPYCGGTVKIDLEANNKSCFCIHCGQQIIIDDEVKRSEYKEVIEDVAKVKEVEYKEKKDKERYQHYMFELERYTKTRNISLIFTIIACVISAVLCNSYSYTLNDIGYVGIFICLAAFVKIGSMKKPLSPDEQDNADDKEKNFNESFLGKH